MTMARGRHSIMFFVSCVWVTKRSEWVLAILMKCFKSKVLSKLFIKSFYFIQCKDLHSS
jgi:hypothetical protein